MRDDLDGVRALVPATRVEPVESLGGSRRSRVRRVRTDSGTLIVKEFTGDDGGWVRESAALSVLPVEVRAPRLVAVGTAPPTVVMSDAGPGPSVADALLADDPGAAADAVVEWAVAIARLHRATSGSRQALRDALAARSGARDRPIAESDIPESHVAEDLDSAAETVARECADLAVDIPAGALDELRGLATRLGGTGAAALTPGDACPDNNVRTGDGLVLIDFEDAQWRHTAWDVAYLVVPWPSCWCSWRIPSDVAERAFDAYRATFGVPDTDAERLRRDVDAAGVGWAFISASWLLSRLRVDDTPPADPRKRAPSRRAMIMHRLAEARRSTEAPALAELAARLHGALAARWGELVLPYAPAFARS